MVLTELGIYIGINYLGFAVGEGIEIFGFHLHHSITGIILTIIAGILVFSTKNKTTRFISILLLLMGVGLVIHHISVEKCLFYCGIF